MIRHDYMMTKAIILQEQAAGLSRLSREYMGLGPSWLFYARSMQEIAAQHYTEARKATDYIIARDALRRAAVDHVWAGRIT